MKRTVVIFYVLAFLLNAKALTRTADLLPYDSPVRAPLLRVLKPCSELLERLKLDALRSGAEKLENRYLED